jgi:hypothetical protein
MKRTLLLTLIGIALATIVASRFEGVLRAGVLCGYLLGVSISLLGIGWQKRALRDFPKKVLLVMVVSFMVKLVALLAGALLLRYVDSLAAVADWRAYLVAFAVATTFTLLLGVLDNSRALRGESAL